MKSDEPEVAVTTGGTAYLSSRCIVVAVAFACLVGCSQKAATTTSSISAIFDQTGQHPATAKVTGAATVSCSDGSGSQGNPVDCMILAPGYMGEVALHKSVSITDAGMVQLTCSAQGRCTAVVTQ
jgi:hypothetical protein